MIIFYNKTTGDIFGVIAGRMHDHPEKEAITVSNVKKKDTGKYVVPFKNVFREEKVPIKKWFIVDQKTMEAQEKVVGYNKEMVPDGMAPDVDFADLILAFESGTEDIYNYQVKLDKAGKVTGFAKK